MQRRQSAGVISSTPPVGPAMPALLISASRPPSCVRGERRTSRRPRSRRRRRPCMRSSFGMMRVRTSASAASDDVADRRRAHRSAESVLGDREADAGSAGGDQDALACQSRPDRRPIAALSLLKSHELLLVAQRDDRAQDDEAEDDRARRIGQRRAGKQRLQRGEQQHAAEHAEIMAAPAGDQRAADDHDGDRRQQILIAHAEARLAGEAGEQDADQRGAERRQHVDEDQRAADRDAGKLRRRARRCRCRRRGGRTACGRAGARRRR